MIELHIQKYLHTAEGNSKLDISLEVAPGMLLAVYGRSGMGKTTLLRMLAGLTRPDGGLIRVNGQVWFDHQRKINLAPQKRKTGLLFQEYALFPHMTVRQNMEYALTNPKDKPWIDELLAMTGLTELALRQPHTLSGGQQQRVALGRALARKPQLLLLDEPLSSLDQPTRYRLQDEIVRLHRQFRLTTLLVSHDPSEITRMADWVVEMEAGGIIRQGTPAQLFPTPGKITLQGLIKTLTPANGGWLVGLESGDTIHEIFVRYADTLNASTPPWQIGNQLSVTLDYTTSVVSQAGNVS